ncbi:S41 family peptidase [Candidatus Saccharibacteria bacterium]|nr:S41 family peptidase [Candidatus Saccharibacteria bacterium]
MSKQSDGSSSRHGSQSQSVRRYSGSFVVFGIAIALVIGFIAGTRGGELFALLGPQFGINVSADSLNLSSTQEVYRALKNKYNGDIDSTKLSQFASKGLVQATGDPYTEYYTAEEAKKLRDDLEGKIGGGIGAELGVRNDKVSVVRPLKGSPAAKAGLRAGDVFVGVNGVDVSSKTIDEVVQMVRGEVGTSVELVMQRGSAHESFSIKRAEVVAEDVEVSVKDKVGIIKLNRFGAESAAKVRAAAEDIKRQDPKGVILDVRGNGGGYLHAGVDIASVWLDDKLVVSERGKAGENKSLKSSTQPILGGVPTVVLINAGSASASEIVAGALRDHGAATLMGEKTYGKGSVQEMISMSNGDLLKVTSANWYTPKGKSISKEGIKPQIKVDLTHEDVNNDKDPQLDAAISHLLK